MMTKKQLITAIESTGAEKAHEEKSGKIKGISKTYGDYYIRQDKETKAFSIWLNSSSWSNRKRGFKVVQLLKDEPNVTIDHLEYWLERVEESGKEN